MGTGHYEGMLNPGFCAVLLAAMVEAAGAGSSTQDESRGLPWLLAYLLMPFALHQGRAKRIESSKGKSLEDVIRGHPELLADLDRYIANAAPFVRQGLALAISRNTIQVNEEHLTLIATEGRIAANWRRLSEILAGEDWVCVRAAARLGQWAVHESVSQICTILRIQPTWHASRMLPANRSVTPNEAS